MVASGISFLTRCIAVGPLRRRRHPNSFSVHRPIKISFFALPVLNLCRSTIVRLVEDTARIGNQQRPRDDAVGQHEMTGWGADTDNHRTCLQQRPYEVEPALALPLRHVAGLRPRGIDDIALLVPLDFSRLQVVRGDRVELAKVEGVSDLLIWYPLLEYESDQLWMGIP